MAREGSGSSGDRRPRLPEDKLAWLERTGPQPKIPDGLVKPSVRAAAEPPAEPAHPAQPVSPPAKSVTEPVAQRGEETSQFAPVAAPVRSAEPAPMTRREARARDQARSAEQTRRSNEQQVLSQRRAAEQARGEQTGVIRPVRPERAGPAVPVPATAARPSPSGPAPGYRPSPSEPSRGPSPGPGREPSSPSSPYRSPSGPVGGMREPKPRKPANPLATAALLVASVALLAWSATAFVGPALPGVQLLAALSPLISVLALPVIALSTGRRSLVSGVMAGVAAIVPWTFAAGYAVAGPGPTSAVGGSRTLRLMFLDAAAGSADPASITAVTRSQGVDVLVMTGLSDPLSHDLAVAGLNRLVTPRFVSIPGGGSDGIGVWSRQGTATLELVPGSRLPMGQGLLTTPAGTLDLVVAQLPGSVLSPGSGWADQLKLLAARPAMTRDRVLVGDLNATPWHAGFRSFTGSTWHDAADVVGRGLRPTWPSWSPLPITPTDHVLLSPGLGASAADTLRVRGTSHRATLVTLVVPG